MYPVKRQSHFGVHFILHLNLSLSLAIVANRPNSR